MIIHLQPLTNTQSLTRRAHYHCCDVFHLQVNIPSNVNEAAMQRCWQALKALKPGLEKSELLYKLAGTTPALLVHTSTNWLSAGSPPDLHSFVLRHNNNKLLSEVRGCLPLLALAVLA